MASGVALKCRHAGLAMGLVALTTAQAQDLTPSEVFHIAAPSIVVIESLDANGDRQSQGSGVVIASGQVITNCHVVDQAKVIVVRLPAADRYGELLYRDQERDLCQVSVKDLDIVPIKTRPVGSVQIGEVVYAIGAPRGLELTLSNGIVSGLRPLHGSFLVQTTAAISPGSSGGGLFDAHGNLIGITTLYYKESQALNFALPTDWIGDLPIRNNVAQSARLIGDYDRRVKVAKEKLNALEKWLQDKYTNYRQLRPQFVERGKKAIAGKPPEQWPNIALVTFMQIAREAEQVDDATRWRPVYKDLEVEILLDRMTVSRRGSLVTAWHEDRYTDPATPGDSGGARKGRIQAVWNCADRSFRYLSTFVYDDMGKLLESYEDPPNGQFGPVVPSTFSEIKWNSVCK